MPARRGSSFVLVDNFPDRIGLVILGMREDDGLANQTNGTQLYAENEQEAEQHQHWPICSRDVEEDALDGYPAQTDQRDDEAGRAPGTEEAKWLLIEFGQKYDRQQVEQSPEIGR